MNCKDMNFFSKIDRFKSKTITYKRIKGIQYMNMN